MTQRNNNYQIRLGLILSYATIIVGIFTGLVYTPWMLSVLGSSDYGIYTIANSIISILLMDFGLSIAVTRYTAKYLEEGDLASLEMFYGVINKLYFIIDCFIFISFIIFFFLIPSFYQSLTIVEISKFRTIFVLLAIYSLISFQFIPSDGILTAYEEFIVSKACVLLVKTLTVIATAFFLHIGFGLYAIVGCHIFFGVAGIVFKKLYIKYKLRLSPNYKADRSISYKELGSFAGWITVIQLSDRLFLSIIPTVLGAVSGSFEVALFGIAVTLESFIFSIVSTANTLFFPKVSRTFNADDEKRSGTMNLMIQVGKLQTFIGGLIICGFAAIGKPFITIWAGNEYINAYLITLLLIIPVCVEQAQGIALLAMQVSGQLKQIAIAQIVCGFANVILALFLGEIYGAVGGAIALFVAKSIKIAYDNFIFNKIAKLNMIIFYKNVILQYIPVFAVTIVIGLLLKNNGFIKGWASLIFSIILLLCVYALLSWFFALGKENKEIIKGLYRSKIQRGKK